MSEAKPTPGECWVDAHMNVISSAGLVAFPGCSAGFDQKKNAHLIAEAFNAHHQTGLTPSQLVERGKELEEALTLADLLLSGANMNRANVELKVRAALSKARPNTAEGEAAQQAPAAERENLELRRMLCIAHAGAAAYMDDGEAQDNRELPLIDFLHDTPAEIQDKLQRRALKKLAMTTEATTARWPSYEVAVSDPVFQVARSIMGTENMGQDRQLVAAINHVLAAAPTPAAAKEPSP